MAGRLNSAENKRIDFVNSGVQNYSFVIYPSVIWGCLKFIIYFYEWSIEYVSS